MVDKFTKCVIVARSNNQAKGKNMSDNGTPSNVITSNDLLRITDKTWFVGNKETRKYRGNLVLCRKYMHTEEVAQTRQKHPNVTAIHCMVSESNIACWGDDRLAGKMFDNVLRYRFDNPSVVPGINKYMRVEFRDMYVTPWYWVGSQHVLPDDQQFKINYAIHSLGDDSVVALSGRAINEMLTFFDDFALFDSKMEQWHDIIKTRQDLLLNTAGIIQKQAE